MQIKRIDTSKTIKIPSISTANAELKKSKLRRRKIIKYTLICGSVTILFLGVTYAQTINDFIAVATFSGDNKVAELADGSGMNLHGKAMFLRTNPELVDANKMSDECSDNDSDSPSLLGCYDPGADRIYIININHDGYSDSMYVTAAHEMLHAAWMRMDDAERASISKDLQATLDSSHTSEMKDIKATLKHYKSEARINEANSLIGSQIIDDDLKGELGKYYERYFSDRSQSVDKHLDYTAYAKQQVRLVDEMRHDMRVQLKKIDAYKKRWLDPFEYQMKIDSYYGDYVTYNKNVAGYNNNLKNYNAMVDDYKASVRVYNSKVGDMNAFYKTLYATKDMPSYLK